MNSFKKLKKFYKRPRNWFFTILALPIACIAYFFVGIGFIIALWISAPVLDHFFPSKNIDRYLAEQEYELLDFKAKRYFADSIFYNYWHIKFPENVNPIPLNAVSYDYALVSDDYSPDEKSEVEWIIFPIDKFPDSSGVPKQGKGFKCKTGVGSYIYNYVPGNEPGEFYIKGGIQ